MSAFLLRDDHHHHHHGHDDHDDENEDHEHDDDHDHHDHDHHAAYKRDNNLRAAFVHVAADVVVSVLVIAGLYAARELGWLWLDPVIGLLGATVVATWAWTLVRSAGAILLDMCPDPALPRKIAERIERDGVRIYDLHVWRVGPGHVAAIVGLTSEQPESAAFYKDRLSDLPGISHLTIEIQRYPARD